MPDDVFPPAGAAPWTTLGSRTLLDDRWIRLRADHLRTATGEELAPWYVLDYPDWCAVVPLTEDGRLVLVRQWRHAAQCWSLELPGGVIDPTDADPIAAARRELLEETGFGGGAWRGLFAGAPNPAIQSNRLHVMLATGLRRFAEPTPDPGEAIRVELHDPAALMAALPQGALGQMMHVGPLILGLQAAGVLRCVVSPPGS